MPVDPVRDCAIDVLVRYVEKDMHLDQSLDRTLQRRGDTLSERGRRFLTQIVYGTVRHQRLCDHALEPLLRAPLAELPLPMQFVLRLGVFQVLFCNQVTFPAMVHTSVDLARKRGHAGLAKLANAVLRRAPKSLEEVALPEFSRQPATHIALRHSLPDWLADRWVQDYGAETALALAAGSNAPAPVSLRVNTAKTSVEELLPKLAKAGFAAAKRTPVPEEITLLEPGSPARSKLFQSGLFMLQDPASMLAAHLMQPEPGARVLELCAAPGGKVTHLGALVGAEGLAVGLDVDKRRIGGILDNAQRLGLPQVRAVRADAASPPFRAGFDAVLLDAPCSGLGTLRRHPDLKWRARPNSVARLAEQQRNLLRRALALCKNGGVVVYSVCTLTPEETTGVIASVLAETGATPEPGPKWMEPWQRATGQYQTMPTTGDWDGFFLTRLRKPS